MFRCMLLSLLVTLAGGACLPNAIPPSERKLLENSNGESYPFGVWIANYAASYAANVMVQVLIEEVFGFNTTSGLGPGTVSGFYGVGGCLNPNDNNDPQCGTEVPTKYHLNMEAWVNGYPLVWKNLQLEHPKTAPDDLGSMGYAGYAGSFLTEEVITTAHKTEGIALQYYKFWNASWYEPSKYTNTITDFNLSRWLKPCMNSDSVFMDDTTMRRHIQFTGDLDGLVLNTSNSRYYAKCQDGYFWRAPSCRGNASQCVPFVTGGSGWSIEEMMQKSVVLYMPLGLAVAAGWTEYTQIPFHYPKMQVYWWVPDPSFLELAPQMMQWAPLDKRGWANGYQVSQLGSIPIKKLVSRDLMVLAPNVRSFVSNIMISLKQMDEILLDQKNTSATWEDATCKWLLANEPVWRSWIPDESQCFPGFGLYDSVLKDFVDARENATNKIICQACASGTYSTPLSDNVGDTFICMPCPKGTSQPLGAASSCKPCKQGEYQGETGQKTCNRCPISTYQDEEGTEVCKACPAGTTTLGLQSVAASDCGCDQNSIDMDPTDAFWCQPCGEGLTCPSSSSL
ncbi:Uncharacterized protein SCF082_LOCUS42432, partial [Durusdinium trenchii]